MCGRRYGNAADHAFTFATVSSSQAAKVVLASFFRLCQESPIPRIVFLTGLRSFPSRELSCSLPSSEACVWGEWAAGDGGHLSFEDIKGLSCQYSPHTIILTDSIAAEYWRERARGVPSINVFSDKDINLDSGAAMDQSYWNSSAVAAKVASFLRHYQCQNMALVRHKT